MSPRFYSRTRPPKKGASGLDSRIKSELRNQAIEAVIIRSGDSYASCPCASCSLAPGAICIRGVVSHADRGVAIRSRRNATQL